jgi:CubicO group peptidase (beta-lactamase class C family)
MGQMNQDLLRDGVAYADQWVSYQQERRELPGVVVAIRYDDTLLLCKGYGHADLERQIPMTPEHIFRIASHSKTFTATAIMQLVEAGKLRLDDPLADAIPWLRDQVGLTRVTIRQALNHTTGIVRNGDDADYWQLDQPFPDSEELRRLVENGGVVLDANTSFKYSNIAYALLGVVIEAASGMPYDAYVTQHIINRLRLADTGPDTDARCQARLATGYTARRFGLPHRSLPDVTTNALAPATGFYSTAEDLCRYAAGHFFGNEALLSDASKREMQQPYWKVAQADMHYGLGFAIHEINGRRFVGHGGAFPGHATMTIFDPSDRLVVVVLTNEVSGPAAILAHGIVTTIGFALKQNPAPEGSASSRERFTGRFANIWGITDIAAFGDALVGLHPEADDPAKFVTRLAIMDEQTLRVTETHGMAAPGERVRYVRDAAGDVTKVIMGGTSAYPVAIYRERSIGG